MTVPLASTLLAGVHAGRIMAFSTASSIGPVRQGHQLDAERLAAYIRATLPDLAQEASMPLTLSQFSHGQSNPTYLLVLGSGRRLVLRKKPPGQLLASAHAVEREYAVLNALSTAPTSVPVPRPLVLCSDPGPVGTPFYLMEFAEGTVFLDPNLPGGWVISLGPTLGRGGGCSRGARSLPPGPSVAHWVPARIDKTGWKQAGRCS